jgi:O-6-methylguanine DNA methyltransferase
MKMINDLETSMLILGSERYYQHLPFQFNTTLVTTKPNVQQLPTLAEQWVVQVVHTQTAVLHVRFVEDWRIAGCLTTHTYTVPFAQRIKQAWHAYTQVGNPTLFEALPVDFTLSPTGLTTDIPHTTVFQQQVWHAVAQVSAGTPCTYGQLAIKLGKPAGTARSIGQALARNPVPLLIPCHRVSSKTGGMTNFCGSAKFVEIKQFLQTWEQALF